MKIKDHLLFDANGNQVDYHPTPNKRGTYKPQYLIMHYTAVTTAQSTINWFLNRQASASAHLLIDRDGSVHQFAPFNEVCWHAGESHWAGLSGLNKYSIGIELVNGGRLTKVGESYICPVDKKTVPNQEVMLATHRNEQTEHPWHEYTEQQLEVAQEIAAVMAHAYRLKDVLGHDDISPIRKSDPGPAFPMKSFRAKALGRENPTIDEYNTAVDLNIRSGPGTGFPVLTQPLPPNTKVLVMKREGNWSFVEVIDVVHGLMDLEGWVFTKYLSK